MAGYRYQPIYRAAAWNVGDTFADFSAEIDAEWPYSIGKPWVYEIGQDAAVVITLPGSDYEAAFISPGMLLTRNPDTGEWLVRNIDDNWALVP